VLNEQRHRSFVSERVDHKLSVQGRGAQATCSLTHTHTHTHTRHDTHDTHDTNVESRVYPFREAR
jgi:hypothetical protein